MRTCAGLLILAALFSVLPVRVSEAQVGRKQVLVLFSTGRDAQVSVMAERQLPRLVERGLSQTIDYYAEYIDAGRFSHPDYRAGFRDFLRLKYGEHRFDVVIGLLDVATDFLHEYRDEVFPGSPVVFFTTRSVARPFVNATGVISETDFAGTLSMVAALQPETTQVFVVSGAGDRERTYERRAREQFQTFASRFTMTYLSGLPTDELERRLAALPEHSVVMYLLVYADGDGETFLPLDYLDRLARVANRPIYSWVDSAMNHGVVGGSMRSIQSEIDEVSSRTLEVLRGRPADEIPTTSPRLYVNQVDWRQLRRWAISTARVPAGSVMRFRELTVWDRYKVYIVGAAVLVLAQSLLIGGLLLQAARRRRAEREASRSQSELRDSYARIRDLGARLLGAQEAERSRIARELHDDIGQQLALLAFDLQQSRSGPDRRIETDAVTEAALSRTQSVIRSVQALSGHLHPAKLHLIGLVSAITSLQREFSEAGMAVTFVHNGVPSVIPYELALGVYRIVQEGIRNAMKHSATHYVSVHLSCNQHELVLTIADDGVGFDVGAAEGKGLGLISMRERIEALRGALQIRSAMGRGTQLELRVPLSAAPRVDSHPASEANKVA